MNVFFLPSIKWTFFKTISRVTLQYQNYCYVQNAIIKTEIRTWKVGYVSQKKNLTMLLVSLAIYVENFTRISGAVIFSYCMRSAKALNVYCMCRSVKMIVRSDFLVLDSKLMQQKDTDINELLLLFCCNSPSLNEYKPNNHHK